MASILIIMRKLEGNKGEHGQRLKKVKVDKQVEPTELADMRTPPTTHDIKVGFIYLFFVCFRPLNI